MNNARFWDYINGSYVKLTLRPGQQLHHYQGGPNEEGWNSLAQTWELSDDGTELTYDSFSDGADCDGRMSRGYTGVASSNPRTFVACYEFNGKRPIWKEADAYQRDYQAEAAGY